MHRACLEQGRNTAAQTSSLTQNQSLLEAHHPSLAMGTAWALGALGWLCLSASVFTSLNGHDEPAARPGLAVQETLQ